MHLNTHHRWFPTALAVLSCLTVGCVTHTTIKDQARQSVRFSSPEAAQMFYDAYLAASGPHGHGSISVYVPTPYWHQTVSTDNVRFNTAVRTADRNHDGLISDDEAQAFTLHNPTRRSSPG